MIQRFKNFAQRWLFGRRWIPGRATGKPSAGLKSTAIFIVLARVSASAALRSNVGPNVVFHRLRAGAKPGGRKSAKQPNVVDKLSYRKHQLYNGITT